MWSAILQAAIDGAKAAPSRRELIAYLTIAAIAILSSTLMGCGSSQLPSISVDVIPAGTKTQSALPAPQVVVVQPTAAGTVENVPQK